MGFDVQPILQGWGGRPCWGLLGMMERAALVGGNCQIDSRPGKGTRVDISVEIPQETGA